MNHEKPLEFVKLVALDIFTESISKKEKRETSFLQAFKGQT
jgi:hypothetical protein